MARVIKEKNVGASSRNRRKAMESKVISYKELARLRENVKKLNVVSFRLAGNDSLNLSSGEDYSKEIGFEDLMEVAEFISTDTSPTLLKIAEKLELSNEVVGKAIVTIASKGIISVNENGVILKDV